MDIGEAAMASIGSDYSNAPLADTHGVRVSIPGHPEIIAYKLAGGPKRDRSVDDLLELHRLVAAQEAFDENK
jgi:hypothetical protein